MKWILIVVWTAVAPYTSWQEVSMQEFGSLTHCQFASSEIQKRAPKVQVVCVEKGEGK